MRVLLNAVPFGYGPAAKVVSVARGLAARGVDCLFVGSGVAFEFVAREAVCDALEVDLTDASDVRSLHALSRRFDRALTCMEPRFVDAVAGIPTGYVDSLSWMWDRRLFDDVPRLRTVDQYFVQDVFNAVDHAAALGIENVLRVGAIVDVPSVIRQRESHAVVHLGGVENIFVRGDQAHYPRAVLDAVVGLDDLWERYESVTVVCGEQARSMLASRYRTSRFTFASARHAEFLDLVSTAQLCVTAPGLTTFLEMCAMGMPQILLPAQNYSQVLILRELGRTGYPPPIWHWSSLVAGFSIAADTPEQAAVAAADGERDRAVRVYEQWLAESVGFDGVDSVCDLVVGTACRQSAAGSSR